MGYYRSSLIGADPLSASHMWKRWQYLTFAATEDSLSHLDMGAQTFIIDT